MISQSITISNTITSGESSLLSNSTTFAATEGVLPYVIILSGTAKTISLAELTNVSAIFIQAKFTEDNAPIIEGEAANIGVTLNLDPSGTETFEILGECYLRRKKTDGLLSIAVDPLGETNTMGVRIFVICE